MALNREERKLLHQKSKQPTFGIGKPSQEEGNNGDITFRKIEGSGTVEYVKQNENWIAVASSGEMPAVRLVGGSGGGSSGVSVHSSLGGLLDDDHKQYILVDGTRAFTGAVTVGSDGLGHDVTFHSGTGSDLFFWDASEEKLTITGTNAQTALDIADGNVTISDNLDVDGTTNLDAVDIDGNVQLDGTFTIGTSGNGYEVIMHGSSSGNYIKYDDGADELILTNDTKIMFHDSGGEYIGASADGHLEIDAGTTLDITAPTVDLNSSTEFNIDTAAYDLNATDTTSLTMAANAASTKTMTIAASNSDGSNVSAIDIDADGAITIDSATSISIGANADKPIDIDASTLDIDTSDNITITAGGSGKIVDIDASGALTIDSATSISIGVNADKPIDIDSSTLDIDASGAVTIDSTSTILISGDGGATFSDDTEAIVYDGSGNLDFDAVALDMDLTDSSSITITSSEAAEDLTIQQVGGNDSSIIITAAGIGDNAIDIDATAGSMIIAPSLIDNKTLTVGNTNSTYMLFSPDDTAADEKVLIKNAAGTDDAAIKLWSAAGGITLLAANDSLHIDADGTGTDALNIDSAGGIDVDAAGVVTIDGADDSNLTVTASGKDLDIAVVGGGTQELRLASAGTGASAIHFNASAGGIDVDSFDMIDIDAADEITIDTTSADGHIAITSLHAAGQAILISANADAGSILDIDAGIINIDVQDEIEIATTSADGHIILASAHTSGLAFHIDANEDAASEVQIDAGILDIDVTGAATIDSGGAMTLTGAGVNLAGGSSEIDITTTGTLDVNANALDMDLTDASSIAVTSSTGGEDFTIQQIGANDSSIIITAAGTGANAIDIDATAGSMLIAASLANAKTLTIGPSSAVQMVFSPHGTAASEKWITTNTSGTSVTEGSAAIQLLSESGGIGIKSKANLANAILITADGGTSETIKIHSDQGETNAGGGAASIQLTSDAGGIELTAGIDIDMRIDSASMVKLNTTTNAVHVNNYAQTLFGYYKLHIKSDGNFYTHGEADYKQNYSMISQEYGSASFPATSVFGWAS